MTWPTSPIIIIKNGTTGFKDVHNVIAAHTTPGHPEDGYTILTGDSARLSILPNFTGDSIIEWEKATVVPAHTCAAVPIGELSFLRDVFMGSELSKNQIAAIQRLSSYLPRTVADESE